MFSEHFDVTEFLNASAPATTFFRTDNVLKIGPILVITEGKTMSSFTSYSIRGQVRPAAEQITCTCKEIDDLMHASAAGVRNQMQQDIDRLDGSLSRSNADLATSQGNLNAANARFAATNAQLTTVRAQLRRGPANHDQVKNAHNSVKTAVKVARAGLFGAAWAFLAGTLNQIPSIVAMGWCDKQQGPGAKAECYTTGVTAILVGVCAGTAGIYALKGSYAQYIDGRSHDPDTYSAV